MNRSREFSRPAAADRSAAFWPGVFVAIALALFQAAPLRAQGFAPQRSIVGSAAADFTLPDIEGRQVRLSDFRGKFVLLAFWATWCPPCKQELPTLQKIYEQFQDKGLVVLALDDEQPATIKDFLSAKHYSFPALVDSKRAVFREFDVHFIPTAIVIRPDGVVSQMVTGWEGPQHLLDALRAAGFGNLLRPANPGNLLRTMVEFSKQETNA